MSDKTITLGTLFKGKLDDTFVKAIDELKAKLISLTEAADVVVASFKREATGISNVVASARNAEDAIKKTKKAQADLAAETKKSSGNISTFNSTVNNQSAEVTKVGESLQKAAKSTKDFSSATKSSASSTESAVAVTRNWAGVLSSLSEVQKNYITNQQKATQAEKNANLSASTFIGTLRSQSAEVNKVGAALQKEAQATKELVSATTEVTTISRNWAGVLSSLSEAQKKYAAEVKRAQHAEALLAESRSKNTTTITGLAAAYLRLQGSIDKGSTTTKEATTAYALLDSKLKAMSKSEQDAVKALINFNAAEEKAEVEAKNLASATKLASDAARKEAQALKASADAVKKEEAALRKAAQTAKNVAEAHRKNKQSVIDLGKAFTSLERAIDKGSISTKDATNRWNALNKKLAALSKTDRDLVNSFRKLGKTVNTTSNKIGEGKAKVTGYTAAVKSLKRAFGTLASYLLAGRAIMLFTQAITGGIAAIGQFDQALHNLQAITGATDTQIAVMRDTLLSLAKDTKFSVNELAQGMVLLGQAGFSAEESIAAIDSVATLASATLSDLETSAQLVTTVIRAFNLSAIESGRVADVMANAINKSKLSIEKLNTAFNYVGVAASQAGLSIEETAATMMSLANTGMRASSIGTGLRQVLARLVAPNRKLQQAFKEQNIALSSVNPSVVGYGSSLKALAKVLWNTETNTVNMSKAFTLFGLRGAQAAAALVKAYVGGQFDTALKKVNEFGTATEMMTKQQEGLAFMFKNLKDNLDALAQAIGDAGFTGAMKGLVAFLQASVKGLTSFFETSFGQLTIKITGALTAIAALRAGFLLFKATAVGTFLLELTSSFGFLATSMLTAGEAMTALTLGIEQFNIACAANAPMLIVTAISVAITALIHFSGATERSIKALEKQTEQLKAAISGLQLYKDTFNQLHNAAIKGEDVNKRWHSTLLRLIDAYPELARVLDVTKASYEEIQAAIDKIQKSKEDARLKTLVETYNAYKKQVSDAGEVLNIFGEGLRDSSEATAELKKAQEGSATATAKLVLAIQEQATKLHLSGKEAGDFAFAVAKAHDANDEFANIIRTKVIAALDAQAKRINDLKKDQADYYTVLSEQITRRIAQLGTLTTEEQKYAAAYKKAANDQLVLLKAGVINAEKYLLEEAQARKKFLTQIVANRKKAYEDMKALGVASNGELLAAHKAYIDASNRLDVVHNDVIKHSYKLRVEELKASLAKEEITQKEFNQKMFDLQLKHNADLKKFAEDELLQVVAVNAESVASREKALNEIAKLEQQKIELIKKTDNATLANYQQTLQDRINANKVALAQITADTAADQQQQLILNAKIKQDNELLAIVIKALAGEYKKKGKAAKISGDEELKALRKTVAIAKKAYEDGTGSLEAYKKAVLELYAAEHKVSIAIATTRQRVEEAKTGFQTVADEGIAHYTLALTDLDIALAKGNITEARYHKESLREEKAYWEEMVETRRAALEVLVTEGLKGTNEYLDVKQQLRDAELELIDAEKALREENHLTTQAMNVSESVWKSFAEKVGLTVKELKDMVEPAVRVKEAARKAASVPESAWKSFAEQVGLTVGELKNAVGGIVRKVKEASTALAEWDKKWRGTFTYVGGPGYFEQRFGDIKKMTLDALLDLNKEMENYREIWFGGGWWDEYNTNLQKYKQKLGNAINNMMMQEAQAMSQEAIRQEKEVQLESLKQLKEANNERLGIYKERLNAHQEMITTLKAQKDELLAKIKAIADEEKAINQSIADQIRDINRESLTGEQTYADDKKQIDQDLSDAKKALLQGDYDTARELLKQALSDNRNFQKEYIQTNADGSKTIIANEQQVRDTRLNYLTNIQNLNDRVNASATAAVQKDLDVNDEQLNAAINEAKQLEEAITSLTDVNLKVDIDAKEAQAVIEELKKPTESTHTVHIKEVHDSASKSNKPKNKFGFASGGVVPGVGNTDSVPAMLTPGEIVLPVPVVKSGRITEFLNGLHNFTAPKISPPISRMKFAAGGVVPSSPDKRIQLDFNIGNKIYPVTADESVGTSLITELKTLSLVSG